MQKSNLSTGLQPRNLKLLAPRSQELADPWLIQHRASPFEPMAFCFYGAWEQFEQLLNHCRTSLSGRNISCRQSEAGLNVQVFKIEHQSEKKTGEPALEAWWRDVGRHSPNHDPVAHCWRESPALLGLRIVLAILRYLKF